MASTKVVLVVAVMLLAMLVVVSAGFPSVKSEDCGNTNFTSCEDNVLKNGPVPGLYSLCCQMVRDTPSVLCSILDELSKEEQEKALTLRVICHRLEDICLGCKEKGT